MSSVSDLLHRCKRLLTIPNVIYGDRRKNDPLNRLKVKYIAKNFNHNTDLGYLNSEVVDIAMSLFFEEYSEVIDDIMTIKDAPEMPSDSGMPNQKQYLYNNNYVNMLKRYCGPAYLFCQNSKILDSCSGKGWGSYIISKLADEVVAVELDKHSIDFAKSNWKSDNIEWLSDSVLSFSSLVDKKSYFDVAVANETVEHFSKDDGVVYIENLFNMIKTNGLLIGSTRFFKSREEAESSDYQNMRSHVYAWTLSEFNEFIVKFSSDYKIINNTMFIARKTR